ncbi:6-phosphogluconate dehydrogenase, NADP(+)-dependent, decarboxylating [Neptunitalea chrysea]|uniref:6-phosphogluconate dehydrogenase, decarboxylating n=1 Tax=Neptunitalea chrysea TaxID=1647581 RepID=A0A9W6B7N9_9FLAO|nr:NADP-dependent phosphogluconate dehydrogenase [Neptunitalea chrysea]GLB52827.1 6-phosphogluconate dehydrogenase, NADP(+)-dependent, decarboxylating [Neptunitalea chrysea]
MEEFDFGMVGLGVMGRNLLLNMADHGFSVAGLDLDAEKAASLENEASEKHHVKGTTQAQQFVTLIKKPRAIMLLVPAGKPVDAVIDSLLPYLEEGDIVVDGGNSYFPDTNRRVQELESKGIHFFGMGISGGEKGARFGPSMMPGGNKAAYERLRPIFEAIAAKINGEPCVTYLGTGSAGNYVKMVHNGIEYAIMELIAETYDLLKRGFGVADSVIQKLFADWNESELASFLIEITADILKKEDEVTGKGLLLNYISDTARAKGTGKWTSQNAMDIQAPVPSIDAAVQMRDISKYKEERVKASELLTYDTKDASLDETALFELLKDAFYFSMINIYAQGMAQLTIASNEYNYGLNLEEVAKIWRGGCIIRAVCLEDFRQAYQNQPELPNLLLDEALATKLKTTQQAARDAVKLAIDKGVPVSVFMSALAYFDSYRSETLPTNMIQAQRDFFGAHKYERIDKEGVFHTEWN